MQRFFCIIMAAVVTLLSSCSISIDQDNLPCSDTTPLSITATMGDLSIDEATKASATTVVRLQWNAGDRISVINLTTGKALGGDLTALSSGTTTEFSGTLTGSLSANDMLGFIYPSQGYTEEQDFSGATIDLSAQNGAVTEDCFALSAVKKYDGGAGNYQLTFNFLVSYVLVTMADLPANASVEEICVTDIGNAVNVTANSARSGFVTSESGVGNITITPASMTTNANGTKSFFLKVPASQKAASRKIKVASSDFDYVAPFATSAIPAKKFYNLTVTDFEEALYVPDATFEAYLLDNFDTNNDGKLSRTECNAITTITVCSDNIESAKGIEHMPNLRWLSMSGTGSWSTINSVRSCTSSLTHAYDFNRREHVNIDRTSTVYIPFTDLQTINDFITTTGSLKSIDVSKNGNLMYLSLIHNDLTSLDVSCNQNLQDIRASSNPLTSLLLPAGDKLTDLSLDEVWLTSLDVSGLTQLRSLACRAAYLSSLDVSNNTALTYLSCDYNQLRSLDVSYNMALQTLECNSNQLSSLNVSNNTALTLLGCRYNRLSSLDVSNNTALTYLSCDYNQLRSLDVSYNMALQTLECNSNQLSSLNVSNNTALTYLACYINQLSSLDISHNTALQELNCSYNNLTSLDVSHNSSLSTLTCNTNKLTNLNIGQNSTLRNLDCAVNDLATIDISQCSALMNLDCCRNQLATLDVRHNPALTSISCSSNQITAIDLNYNTSLTTLYCDNNQIATLDVSNNTALRYLYCGGNKLEVLDLFYNSSLKNLYCPGNSLKYLDFTHTAVDNVDCRNNPDLSKMVFLNGWNGTLYKDSHTLVEYIDEPTDLENGGELQGQ